MRDGLVGKRGPDLAGDGSGKCVGVAERAHQEMNGAGAALEDRKKILRRGLVADANIARVGDDTDDFSPFSLALVVLGHADALSEHVQRAPVFLGHGFVDDYRFGGTLDIALAEVSATAKRDSQSEEIGRVDVARVSGTLFSLSCRDCALDPKIAVHHGHAGQEAVVGGGKGFDSWDAANLFEDLFQLLGLLLLHLLGVALIPDERTGKIESEEAVGAEPGILMEQVMDGLSHQSGADEENKS